MQIDVKNLDENDYKILETLLKESRTSFSELAKICGISVTAVRRRYLRLKKTGIICNESMYLNPSSLGYGCIADVGIITDFCHKEEVAQHLKTILKLVPSSETDFSNQSLGKYTLFGLITAKNTNQLTETVAKIDQNSFVKRVDVLLFSEPWNNKWYPENIRVDVSKRKTPLQRIKKSNLVCKDVILDALDRNIIKMLMKNSRVSFSNMAKSLKISNDKVAQRYKFIRENNVLNLSTISLDLKKLGYNGIIDVFVKVVKKSNLSQTKKQLLAIPNLSFLTTFVGGFYDLRCATIVADFEDISHLKKQFNSMRNIQKVEFYFNTLGTPWPIDFLGTSFFEQEIMVPL